MELKMKPYAVPEALTFNYEELRASLLEKAAQYESVVYTDDQIAAAKEDRAGLNKLKKALNDERIRQEREYMRPFADFKAKMDDIIGIIDRPVQAIDKQVKAFEERKREEKYAQIEAFWNDCELPAQITLLQIMDTRWLNASVPMKTIKEAIAKKLFDIANDLDFIRGMPSHAADAERVYLVDFDLKKALSVTHDMKAKDDDTQRQWIAFKALLSPDEARELGEFMRNRGIQYKPM